VTLELLNQLAPIATFSQDCVGVIPAEITRRVIRRVASSGQDECQVEPSLNVADCTLHVAEPL
jgi:hypothetical protein